MLESGPSLALRKSTSHVHPHAWAFFLYKFFQDRTQARTSSPRTIVLVPSWALCYSSIPTPHKRAWAMLQSGPPLGLRKSTAHMLIPMPEFLLNKFFKARTQTRTSSPRTIVLVPSWALLLGSHMLVSNTNNRSNTDCWEVTSWYQTWTITLIPIVGKLQIGIKHEKLFWYRLMGI